MREILDTPDKVVENGKFHLGVFKTPFTNLNMLDAGPKLPGGLTSKLFRNLRLKEWQHFSVITKNHFLGIAVVNAKFMGASWCYAVDRKTGELIEHSVELPLRGPVVSRELFDSKFDFKAADYSVKVHNNLTGKRHQLDVEATTKKKTPITGSFSISQDAKEVQPLIVVLPLAQSGPMYSHKVPCPVSGSYSIGGEEYELDPKTDFVILDVHKSYYPYRTWWKWVTFVGRDKKGKILGANLTRGLHGNDAVNNENGIWYGNKLSLLPEAEITIPDDIMQTWKIFTNDGRVDLTFSPKGIRQEMIDFKVIVSWYRAPVGNFNGKLTDDDGKVHEIKDFFGIAEHHKVTW